MASVARLGIGFISTVVLARLLVPADFGIIAMAMIVVGLMTIVTYLGVQAALLRDPERPRRVGRAHLEQRNEFTLHNSGAIGPDCSNSRTVSPFFQILIIPDLLILGIRFRSI